MADNMGKKTKKSFRFEDKTLERWEEYIEESGEVTNMTQLIRLSVHDYITDLEQDTNTGVQSLDLDEMDDIKNEIGEINMVDKYSK